MNKKSSFGLTETKYFWDSNNKVRHPLSKYVPLSKYKHEPILHDINHFHGVNNHRDKWCKHDHTLAPQTNSYRNIV